MSRIFRSAILTPAGFILGILTAWQALVVGLGIPEYLLPSPVVIVSTVEKSLVVETAYTAGEALCGFTIASAFAFVAAVLFVRFRAIEQGLFPLAITLKTTSGSFSYTGTFARPSILQQTGGKFIRMPIPQDVWDMATNTAGGSADQLTVKLVAVVVAGREVTVLVGGPTMVKESGLLGALTSPAESTTCTWY